MAITNIKNDTALVIKYVNGENQDGSPKIQSQKFSKISGTSTDEEIYNLGLLIGAVLINEPTEIKKLDDYTLNED
ncbi:MAG: DUF1659 domain-containing protein [Clostridium sp.]